MTLDTDFPRKDVGPAGIETSPDLDRYWPHVAHLDISDDRKREVIRAVYRVMQNTIDRIFGEDSTQLARIAGDKADGERASAGRLKVGSEHTSETNDDGDLAGVFRRCGDGE